MNHSFEHLVCEFSDIYLIYIFNVAVNKRSLVKDCGVVWVGLVENGVWQRTYGRILGLHDPTIRFVP